MRLKANDVFRVFNSTDGEFIARVVEISKSYVSVTIESQVRSVSEEKCLILALCIIKPDRMLEAVRSAIQLGVTQIIPIISERTQYKKIAFEKMSKVILQATEQSERFTPAKLMPEISLAGFCKIPEIEQVIFACESEHERNKVMALKRIEQQVAILIGPEGGFSEREVEMLKSYKHVYPISLGNTVLRTETAVAAALACVQMVR